jgi:enolase
MAKWNEVLRIEAALRGKAEYVGAAAIRRPKVAAT